MRRYLVCSIDLSLGVIIMTNTEYETASVQAAMGHRKLAAVDKQIEQVESTLVFLLHSRREIVNQYDLNKCTHDTIIAGECIECCQRIRRR